MTDALVADQAPAIDGAQTILNAAILQLIELEESIVTDAHVIIFYFRYIIYKHAINL